MRFRDKANIESGKTPTYVLLSTTNIAPWLKYDAKATRSEKIGYLSRDSSLFYRTGWIFILFAPVKSVYKSRTDSKEHFVLSKLLLFRLKNFMSIFKRKEFRETDFQRDRDFSRFTIEMLRFPHSTDVMYVRSSSQRFANVSCENPILFRNCLIRFPTCSLIIPTTLRKLSKKCDFLVNWLWVTLGK